ncbi:sorbose reductase sou1 [Diaporthe amygdali]|uniref:sorbose reductase sou1 n=1 Tax=Phomopsis amygdali TaxID=1214568 RepID=UPI0022FDDEF7|nr:sorbose reductase sou1 [Diaporthe amygdali]KAJ0108814.1 sorbose reductase sou1 [Diaporthe amygdali]
MGSTVIDRDTSLYLQRSVQDLFSLKGRVTVITGGARGIGLAWAFACAEAGSDVAVLDRLDQPHEHFSKLVNNFGVKIKLYTINSIGTYFAAQLTARQIVKQDEGLAKPKGGSMVFIASISARMASKAQYTSDYCASKGAVVALATQLGCELADRGIRVNTISPGYVATDMTLSIADTRPGLTEVFLSEPPMKRMADRVDLKGAAVFLLSDASAYMTSADMLITGGMHAGRT